MVRGFSNDRFQFVHTDFKVLAGLSEGKYPASSYNVGISFIPDYGKALCEEHKQVSPVVPNLKKYTKQ